MKLQAKDVVAILVILCFVFLKYAGINSEIDTTIILILGYYFVKRQEGKDDGTGGATV